MEKISQRREYQIKAYLYPPVGTLGFVVFRVKGTALRKLNEDFKNKDKNVIEIRTIRPEADFDKNDPQIKNQMVLINKENFYGYYVTPIHVEREKAQKRKEEQRQEELEEKAMKAQEEDLKFQQSTKKEILGK